METNKPTLGPKKVLMATMAMDIGGAETHILELSKALAGRGWDITVASNGGVYVAELEAAGVKHVQIPLHRRSPQDMVRSYFALRRLIRQEGFDIVHAHARIPSFLCGLLWRRMKFPFVTTAHFTFTTGGLAGKLTNWGEQTIAVAEDIKDYLMTRYDVPAQNIFTTVNGIDMERFSANVSGAEFRAELGIPQAAPVLVHVSRLDEGPAIVAERMIPVVPVLAAAYPELRVIIVGGGNRSEQLRAQADAVNATLGRTVIHMTGPRTDINACIGAADVFCGVSRAALEAMSAEKPVVLAGPQGYAGIFGADKLQLSRDTNFCYRGTELPTEAVLEQDLLACLNMGEAKWRELGRYGRETVLQYYSVETMANDTLQAYTAVLSKPKRLLLSGYYGFSNAGDEAILDAFMLGIRQLPDPVEVTVLSNTPVETARKHGCRSVPRFNLLSISRAMRQTDVFVSGGGSLLQDKSSTRSLIYYLAIIWLAKLFGKPVMLYANGIGPVDRSANRRRVRRIISRTDLITLREESSRDELVEMGVAGPPIHVTADPIFLLDTVPETAGDQALRQAGVPEGRPLIGVSVRSLRTGPDFVPRMAQLCDRLTEELGAAVVFIAMQMPHDAVFSQKIMAQMQHPAYLLGGDTPPEAFIGATGRMDLVVAMRLHTMLFAAKAKTPVIGLICDPKIAYFGETLNMPSGGPVEDFDPTQMFGQIQDILAERETHQVRLAQAVTTMIQGAKENGTLLAQLLGLDG